MIEVQHFTAPAYWASFLVNGDSTGFDFSVNGEGDEELAQVNAWLDSIKPAYIVNADRESFFAHGHDAWAFWPYGGDMLAYVAHVQVDANALLPQATGGADGKFS